MDVALFILLFSCLIILQYTGRLDLYIVLWSVMMAYAISSGLGVRLIGHQLIKLWNRKHILKTAKEHYHYSFWLLGTSLVQWFSGNYFLVAAAATLGAVAVGALRMAQNMVGLCHVLFLAMENIVPVEAARQYFSKGEKAMFGYLRRVGGLVAIPVVGLLGSLTLASHWLIGWLYGADYQPFAYLVGAYAVVYALGYVATLQRFALRSMQFTLPIFIGYSASAVASIALAYPMVRQWGMGGVMAGLVGAQLLTLLVYGFSILKKSHRTETTQSQAADLSFPAHPLTPSPDHFLSPSHPLKK
jgi:O-antigen/teichoic acid export membrane protein